MKRFFTFSLFFLFVTILSAQSIQNISLLAQVEYDEELSDVWGYTDENGREYALVGMQNGTSIMDLNTPSNPVEVARIPGGSSHWKDIKTYKNRAFVVGEYPQGIQIIDLNNLPNAIEDTDYNYWNVMNPQVGRIRSCHNIYIEEKTGIAYLSGCINVTGGVIMVDVKPEVPVYLGTTTTSYSHDVYVRNDTVYSSDFGEGVFSISDATNKSNPVLLANQPTPSRGTHNAWLSDNGKTIFTTDEVMDAPVAAYDISDLTDIKLLDEFYPNGTRGTGLVPHNVHVKNDFLITSYYAEGVVITDASRPNNLVQVGNFDTYEGPNTGFFGAWGAFPFFDSDLILVTDIGNGLFILKPKYLRAAFFEGLITDSISGKKLAEVQIEGKNRGVTVLEASTGIDGSFEIGTTQTGNLRITFSKIGYTPKTITANLANGQLTNTNLTLSPLDSTDNTTSLESLDLLTTFEANPNPFVNETAIHYELDHSIQHPQFILTDISGSLIKQYTLPNSKGILSIGLQLNNGLYFGQIITEDGRSEVLKLVRM